MDALTRHCYGDEMTGKLKFALALALFMIAGFFGTGFLLDRMETGPLVPTDAIWTSKAAPKTFRTSYRKINKLKPVADGMELSSTFLKTPTTKARTGGAFFTIDRRTEAAVSGKLVEIAIDISAPSVMEYQELGISYSTAGAGSSPWKIFPVTAGRKTYSFKYKIPKDRKLGRRKATDFLGILSDMSGQGTPIIVHQAFIRLVSSKRRR